MPPIEDSPNKYPLPPLLTVGMIALCFLLDYFLPLGDPDRQVSTLMRTSGIVLILLALAVDAWSFMTFRKHHANIMPHKAATTLMMDGPYAHSRNPIYLANVMLLVGLALVFGSAWFLIGAIVLFFLLNEYAVKREEKHMEANFPIMWKQYTALVRRWI